MNQFITQYRERYRVCWKEIYFKLKAVAHEAV